MSAARIDGSKIVSTLRYRDAAAAIDWLCDAFGFERHLVVPGENGSIAHAQLVFRNGMIMLGSGGHGDYDVLVKPPADIGGIGSQSIYVIVEDVDAHHARAVAAGAEVVMPLEDPEHGGRAYACRDPEGHVWNFGSYDPWAQD